MFTDTVGYSALAQRDRISQSREGLAYGRALLYLSLDNKEQALRWQEQSFDDRDGSNVGYIKVDQLFDSLRGDPRFEALAEKIVPGRKFHGSTAAK